MTEQHQSAEEDRFRAAVPASMKAVNAFADYLRRKGLEAQVNEVSVRPTFEERAEYGDAEDIKARYPDQPWKRFEVKGRTIAFTSREDFPHATIYLDAVSKKSAPPDWYISVSKDLKYAAVIDGTKPEHWRKGTTTVSYGYNGGYSYDVYECPKEFARFVRIAE